MIPPVERLRGHILRRFPEGLSVFKLQPISQGEMRNLLKRYHGGRALPSDMIDGFTIKIASPSILPELVRLINLSIQEGKFCDMWKFEVVVPHHKKGDKFSVDNYHPVCHLIDLGKLTELVMWDQLLKHCLKYHLIHPHHHGSMPFHDCVTAIGQLQDTVTLAADKKELSGIIMLDQTAAFDLVDHAFLLEKMGAYNFHQHTVAWFSS